MKYKYYELDSEEEEILKAFEEGRLVRAKNFTKQKKLLEQAARNTLNKNKNINLRISERDLSRLKAKAVEEGLPYQTLAASILHKYTAQ